MVVNELKLALDSDFMVNPYIVMNNAATATPELPNGAAESNVTTPMLIKIAPNQFRGVIFIFTADFYTES